MDDLISDIEEKFVSIEDILPDIVQWQHANFKASSDIKKTLEDSTEEISLDRKSRKIEIKEPVWVNYLYIETSTPDIINSSLRITVKDISGKSTEYTFSNEKIGDTQKPCVFINDFVKEVHFKSEAIFKRPKIKSIKIYGFNLNDFNLISDNIKEVIKLKRNIDDVKSDFINNLHEIKQEIKTNEINHADLKNKYTTEANDLRSRLDSELDLLESEVDDKKNALDSLGLSIDKDKSTKSILESNISELNSRKLNLDQIISAAETKIALFEREKVELESKISELEQNKNVFSDEYSSYVETSRGHAKTYIAVSIVPLITIFCCFIFLVQNAQNLISYEFKSAADVFSSFFVRLPFTLVVFTIVTACVYISRMLINSYIKTHEAERELSKLLVLAKETVFSSNEGLQIPDEIKFRERIQLKVKLIQSHLKKSLGDDVLVERKSTDKNIHIPKIEPLPEVEGQSSE